ncbi:MAG TPA: hypothetical protein VFL92_11095, partial [Sphingomonas sp.]|nr:hypothetical protein [Sphingomonas sp.]
MTHRLTAAVLLFTLAGCGSIKGYPSLAPRPIEGISLAEPAAPASPPAEASPQDIARYAPIVAKARAADADFHTTLKAESATVLAGRDAAPGSEAWIEAQQSFSRILAARAPVLTALSDLDAARAAPAAQADSGVASAIGQAYAQVQAIDEAERQAL